MGNYDDIINLPHHVSDHHPQMSAYDRAAQFSPFAALSGHGEAIAETARLTGRKIELDEYEKLKLDEIITLLKEHISEGPDVEVTYFCPDPKKDGGEYITKKGSLRKMRDIEHLLVLDDGTEIYMDNILYICSSYINSFVLY